MSVQPEVFLIHLFLSDFGTIQDSSIRIRHTFLRILDHIKDDTILLHLEHFLSIRKNAYYVIIIL